MKQGLTGMAVLTLLQAVGPAPSFTRSAPLAFMRTIAAPYGNDVCAILDSAVFSHATPSLKDLRLLTPQGEVPYVVTISEAADPTTERASVTDLRSEPAGVGFDLRMPRRPYTDVVLELPYQTFILTASVSGKNDLSASASTPLGTFTVFDLTARHLSRNTVLPLRESDFAYLHIDLRGTRLPPEGIRGAQVPPSREAQTLYTDIAASPTVTRRGAETIMSFVVPAHVPIERVLVELPPSFSANFSRTVRVTGRAGSGGDSVETIEGSISQVRLGKVHERQLAFPAVMGINLQQQAVVDVAIEDGSDPPLPVTSIKLQMRQRRICFTAPLSPFALYYGDASLSVPQFAGNSPAVSRQPLVPVELGPEVRNPAFHEDHKAQSPRQRRPDLLWFILLACLGAAGTLMLRTLRQR